MTPTIHVEPTGTLTLHIAGRGYPLDAGSLVTACRQVRGDAKADPVVTGVAARWLRRRRSRRLHLVLDELGVSACGQRMGGALWPETRLRDVECGHCIGVAPFLEDNSVRPVDDFALVECLTAAGDRVHLRHPDSDRDGGRTLCGFRAVEDYAGEGEACGPCRQGADAQMDAVKIEHPEAV